MEVGEHQGSLMVESDAETPHTITESWSVHDTLSTCADTCACTCTCACTPCRSRAVCT